MPRNIVHAVLLVVISCLGSGCVLGTTQVNVDMEPFELVAKTNRTGDILVRRFVDDREDSRDLIGSKRNTYGMVMGHLSVPRGERLEEILTNYFAEALRLAGYRVVTEDALSVEKPADFSPVATIEGAIKKFWLDMYLTTWHHVDVHVGLRNRSEEVVWEGRYEGQHSNALWLALSVEFERVIRQALAKALSEAATDFGSDEFAKQIRLSASQESSRSVRPSNGMPLQIDSDVNPIPAEE